MGTPDRCIPLALVAQGVGQGKISLMPLGGDGKGGFGHTFNKLNLLCLVLSTCTLDQRKIRALSVQTNKHFRSLLSSSELTLKKTEEAGETFVCLNWKLKAVSS